MEGNIILDNDFFVILAGANLLENWMEAIGATYEQIFLLESLGFILKKNSRLSKKHSPRIIEQAKRRSAYCQRLPEADNRILQQFAGIDGIDPGEQQIFAHLATGNFRYAATNDKKSLIILIARQDLTALVSKKIICLEQAIHTLLQHNKWETINEKIQQMRICEKETSHDIDARLSCIFSESTPSEKNTLEAIISYEKEIFRLYAPLLANI